ncbi:MAG: molybdopterin-synthase adenylyltransferase MoeB [Acidobacteria bacterium]|nr:molybdopterin-synthase adenylyltransferase MoeB [Acidobacteriota bacterium]
MRFQFTEEQIKRYSRHIILPEVGGKGQKKLLAGKALIVGAGGLGSPAGLYLAAAGVGTIGVIDADVVDLSNLQRQVLHSTKDLDRPKVFSAQERMEGLNPDIRVVPYHERLTAANALEIIRGYDVILDGSDNFPTKFLVNDACVMLGKPLVLAGILRFDGQLFTILPGRGACYRCIFRKPPPAGLIPSCEEAGILGAVAGVMGTLQAVEALKILLGTGETRAGRILLFDAATTEFREVAVRRDPDCPVCSDHPTITELREEGEVCEIQRPPTP